MAACHFAVTLLCCHHPFQHHPSSSLVIPHHPSTSFIIPIHPQSLIIFHIPSLLLIIHPTTSISLIITNHPPTFTIPHHPSPSINILSPSQNHPSWFPTIPHYPQPSFTITQHSSLFLTIPQYLLASHHPSLLGMSTFRFFSEQTFRVFLSLRKMYFVSFSFVNSKKSKDSFIVY